MSELAGLFETHLYTWNDGEQKYQKATPDKDKPLSLQGISISIGSPKDRDSSLANQLIMITRTFDFQPTTPVTIKVVQPKRDVITRNVGQDLFLSEPGDNWYCPLNISSFTLSETASATNEHPTYLQLTPASPPTSESLGVGRLH